MVKNPPCNAGNLGLVHGWGTKIPQASRQQSPSTTATEPTCSGAGGPQLETIPHAETTKLVHRQLLSLCASVPGQHHN